MVVVVGCLVLVCVGAFGGDRDGGGRRAGGDGGDDRDSGLTTHHIIRRQSGTGHGLCSCRFVANAAYSV